MEEALDQEESIVYPLRKEQKSLITQKHQILSSSHDNMQIFTLVLSDGKEVFASLVLLRKKAQPFTEEESFLLKKSAKLLGPAIALKLKSEHSFSTQIAHKFQHLTQFIFGLGHLKFKLFFLTFILMFATLSLVQTSYYVYAKSTLEGAVQQVIVSSKEGYIKASYVRAGDTVTSGQLLLALEDKELRLEREILFSEKEKLSKEYHEELAHAQRAKVIILLAKISQVDAQIQLIQEKIKHSKFTAPFAGIVVSGDLSQSIGKPVQKGEQLFEIALLNDYRVSLDVDEHDVSKLQTQQDGELRLVGLPYESFSITLNSITPIASAKEGGNYFHVEAHLNDFNNTRLKPGMQGLTKIHIGEASVLWVWTHSLLDKLRLWFWSLGL
jgi:multidrug resistance efflux pump